MLAVKFCTSVAFRNFECYLRKFCKRVAKNELSCITSFSVTVTPGNGLMTAVVDGVNIQQWTTRQLMMLTSQGKQALGRVICILLYKLRVHNVLYYMYFNEFGQVMNASRQAYVRIDKSACWYCWSDLLLACFEGKCNFTFNVHLPTCICVPYILLKFYKSFAKKWL